MIELLGIGVHDGGTWRLRRLSARFERRTLAAVLSRRREERAAVLDVIAGHRIPSEGRAWIAGIPLGADTARRIRRRVGVVDFATPLALDRSVAWNARLGGVLRWLHGARPTAARSPALERVGLSSAGGAPASELDAWRRTKLIVARALYTEPDCLVVPEPDAHLACDDVRRLLDLLRGLVRRDGMSVYASVGDHDLARYADVVLRVAEPEPAYAGPPRSRRAPAT